MERRPPTARWSPGSEFTPEAETIAARRSWTSAGISRRMLQRVHDVWMNEGHLQIYQSCRNVGRLPYDAETLQACPSCGGGLEPPRHFVKPVHVPTNDPDRAGGATRWSRLRPREVDEARLFIKPASNLLGATEVRAHSNFFASALGSANHPVGQMIVVIRGPNATSYI